MSETLLLYFGLWIPFKIVCGQELARGLHGACTERMIKRNEVAKALGNVGRTNTERIGTYEELTELCTFVRGLPGMYGNV